MEGPASSLLVEQDTNVAVQWDTKASTVKVTTSTPTLFKTSFLNKSGMEGGVGGGGEGGGNGSTNFPGKVSIPSKNYGLFDLRIIQFNLKSHPVKLSPLSEIP